MPEGWRPAQGNKGRGHAGFAPTAAERVFVSVLASGFLDQSDICKVVGAARGRPPLGSTTLRRHFARELSGGKAHVKAMIAKGFYAAVKNREAWAIAAGLRNFCNWDKPRNGFTVDLPRAANNELKKLQVEFISPTRQRHIEAELADPPPPQYGAPDLSKPALPAPSHRTVETPVGHALRVDGDDKSWMR